MRISPLACFIGALWIVEGTAQAALNPVGSVVSSTLGSNRVDLTLSSGAVATVEFLDPAIARVRVNPTGVLSSRLSPAVQPKGLFPPDAQVFEQGSNVWLVSSKMTIAVVNSPFQVIAWQADGSLISKDQTNAVFWDSQTQEILVIKQRATGERFFGLGLFGGPIDRSGRSFTLRNTDNSGYTEFTEPLYQSYPFYYGLSNGDAYGVFLSNPAFPFFDMDAEGQGTIVFGAQKGELDYYLFAGPQPFDVANCYSRLTGCNPLPPEWSLGYHHSHYGWSSASQISNIATNLRAMNFPCDALWFDILYMDQLHQFTWDPTNFPNPIALNTNLDAMGFKRVYINEPCLLQTDPLWSYLDASGYFLKDGAGASLVGSIWFGEVSFLDFTRSDLRAWYQKQLATFLSTGISGLWLDLNEPANNFMPQAVYNFDGDPRSDLEARNLYALEEAQTAYAAQLAAPPNVRPWNFSRSGGSGIQRSSHTWSGDAPSTFDSLRVAIQMSISMGLSGQNQFGHDTGGFLGSPSPELFTRWLEFSCFTPLFRNHSTDTSSPREPWSFGEPYTSLIRHIINRRYQFLPYIYTLFEEASRTGRPVLAPTLFYAPGDSATFHQDSDYLLGPNLLVAPVFIEGATNRAVYLPAGSDWVNFWTDQRYAGGQTVTVPSPLGQTPLFARSGAILVRGAVQSYVGAGGDSTLSVDVYPSGTSSFTIYEDDGISFNYQSGNFLRTQISSQWNQTAGQLSIQRVEGSFTPPDRSWKVLVHGVSAQPRGVQLNGNALSQVSSLTNLNTSGQAWSYDPTSAILSLQVRDAATPISLSILSAPIIVSQPTNQMVLLGSSAVFSVSAGGSPPLSYQWLFNGTNILTGETNTVLTVTNVQPGNVGTYSVVVSNYLGLVTNTPATLTVVIPGVQLGLEGQNAVLSFPPIPQLSCTIQYRTNLTSAPWQQFTNVPAQAATNWWRFTDPSPSVQQQRYYRLLAPSQ